MVNPFAPESAVWGLIAVALLFNVALTSLLYIIAQALQIPSLNAQAKENLFQLIFSVFLIAIFIGSAVVLNQFFLGIVCYDAPAGACMDLDSTTPIEVGMYGLDILQKSLTTLYFKMYLFESTVAIISSMSFTLGVFHVFLFVFSVHISPFIALTMIANAQVIIVEGFGYLIGITFAKKEILRSMAYYVPFFLVPFGLFLRAIPFLRTTGSTIIALCFTMYFIFPVAIIFTNYVIYDFYKSTPAYVSFENPSPLSNLCEDSGTVDIEDMVAEIREGEKAIDENYSSEQGYGAIRSLWNNFVGALSVALSLVGNFFGMIWNLVKLLYYGESWATIFAPIGILRSFYFYMVLELIAASQFLVLVTISTILEFIIIVTAHRSISATIGGETEIFGLSKIV
ncbi:MAG: hypothetical protein WC501_01565 [Candidatus Micrarchaeia archaeon]